MNKGDSVKVHNHGFLRLIDYMGNDLSIVRNARQSYDAQWRAGEDKGSDERLIHYLLKNGHNTPFESVEVQFEIHCPIFVTRQWHRHRTQCLAGGTKLYFDLPSGKQGSKYRAFSMTVEEIFRKWDKGAKPISSLRKDPCLDEVSDSETYSVKELSLLTGRREETIRNLCREGELKCIKVKPEIGNMPSIFIEGAEWHRWAKEKRTVFHMQDRIKGMKLRSYNEKTGEIYHTSICDVWKSGVKQLYKVVVDGNSIELSENHPLLTPEGWKKVKNLVAGVDKVFVQAYLSENKSKQEEPTLDLSNESWKLVLDGNGKYEVSSEGRVRVAKTREIIKPTSTSKYKVLSINSTPVGVHRLVWKAFNGEIQAKDHVLHINDNGWDNRLSNLKLGDNKDNASDRKKNGLQQKLTVVPKTVDEIVMLGKEETYDVEVTGPYHNFIADGFCTHNSYNEVSARYTKLPREYYVPYLSVITKQSTDNKQMRTDEPLENAEAIQKVMDEAMFAAFVHYDSLIEMGCPRELARTVLPLGTYTNFFAKANLHNWFRFLHERLHKHAQYEIRRYAQEILAAIGSIAPVAVEAFVSTLTDDHIIYEEEITDD